MPKSSDEADLRLSKDALREVHLALGVRIALLIGTDSSKMGPNERAKLARRIDLCHEIDQAVQKARGK